MKKIKVVLMGPMPPPSGGVSTHLSRLLARSQSEEDLQLSVIDLRRLKLHCEIGTSRNIFAIVRTFLFADIIHFHLSRKLKLRLIKIARFLGKKVVYTHHNSRNLTDQITLNTMGLSHQIILVRPVADALPAELHARCQVVPSYLPATSVGAVPTELKEQFAGKRIIFAHCYQKKNETLLVDGKDLYGFDLILDALEILHRNKFPENCLLFLADPADGMKDIYKERIRELIDKYRLNIIYWNKELDFSAALKYCSVLVRASRSDGDAVSIREALQAGVPVIASDCVERPEGVIDFSTGDAMSLSTVLSENLQNPGRKHFVQKDFAPQIFQIYRSLSNFVEN